MKRFCPYILSFAAFLGVQQTTFAQDFRVQIAAYGERMKPQFFKDHGIENYIETTDQLGLYRYFAGAYKTRDEAEVIRNEMVAKGFPYALIIDLEEQRVLCGAGCPYFRNGTVYVQDPQRQETTNTIYFEFGRYSLTPEAKVILNRFYEQLRDNPALKLRIHGFTDGVGSAEANRRLSAQRARSARNYLSYKGIRPDRMLIEQFGEANPVLPNKDETDDRTDAPENRKWNRRVVLLLVNDFGEAATDETVK
jgi:outer membrane protein OmpA-like peptidoglycan-associated protein